MKEKLLNFKEMIKKYNNILVNNIYKFINKYNIWIYFIIITILAVVARIVVFNKISGDVSFINSTFIANSATAGDGGAIFSDSGSTNIILINSIFKNMFINSLCDIRNFLILKQIVFMNILIN